jgi:hypothetical protein
MVSRMPRLTARINVSKPRPGGRRGISKNPDGLARSRVGEAEYLVEALNISVSITKDPLVEITAVELCVGAGQPVLTFVCYSKHDIATERVIKSDGVFYNASQFSFMELSIRLSWLLRKRRKRLLVIP